MKKYRITYNPYLKETKVEEHYDDASAEWDELGGESEIELNNILRQKSTIQNVGMSILEWLEIHNNSVSNSNVYCIDFCGIKQDFNDLEKIARVYKEKNPTAKLQSINQTGNDWSHPTKIQKKLENKCNEIKKLFENESDTLKNNLKNCGKIEETELNILVLGTQNSGKSTLINALIGFDLLPTSGDVETAVLFTIKRTDEDQIKIITCEGNESVITFKENSFDYSRSTVWLDRIIDNIKNNEVVQGASEKKHKMKAVLAELNSVCKKTDNPARTLKEIEIGLSKFAIMGSDQIFVIKDFPGAGAKYLGEEHKIIIDREISKVTNAVTLYVLKSDEVSHELVQKFLEDLKRSDSFGYDGVNNQIDFERSIYVLNKADSDINNGKNDLENAILREFNGKKVVLTSAEAAIQMQTRKRIDPSLNALFLNVSEEYDFLDLQEKAMLPDSYTKKEVVEMVDNICKKDERTEALKRTGVPLVGALLEDYADSFSAIHKVSCYYHVVDSMLDELKTEQEVKTKSLKELQDELLRDQDNKRKELKDACEKNFFTNKKKLSETSIKSALTENLTELLSGINDSIPDKIKILKQSKEQKKEWRNIVTDDINQYVIEKQIEIINKAQEVKKDEVKKFKDNLLEEIKGRIDKNTDEYNKIEDIINKYNPPENSTDNFALPEKFKLDRNFEGLLQSILNHTEWQINKTQEKIQQYWDEKIVSYYSDPLLTKIIESYEELKGLVVDEIDHISITLIDLQKSIKVQEDELDKLNKNIKKSDEIRSYCKRIIKEGRV